ncbi:polysaccharide biosynthesis protein [Clostridium sp. BJN0001]|uniref:putative polysaccharide biosynthesis protein n=1 Tax=Clostridium sp. BJN0001 TaxID=2930219 RepID=UPI001FD377FE|nr:polysaccharide biosynthesis protein [Clostridium sp. BJN0001]
MKKQSLIKASVVLAVSGIVSRFLGLFFRWPLIMLIGDEGIGYYQMSYPLYMFFIAMASGVPIAISKMISEKNAIYDVEGCFQVLKEAAIFMSIIGIGTTFILLMGSKQIISFLKWDSKAYYALIGISFAPMVISFMTIFRGFFQGFQNMTPSAISQIVEQIGRVIFGVGLAVFLLPKGIEYSAGGAAFGATAGAVFAFEYLYTKYRKIKKWYGIKKVKADSKILDKLLRIAIPISLGATVGTVMNLIDSILVPQNLLKAGFTSTQSTVLYAQLTGKASVIINIPLTLSMALCTSLIPVIAECFILKKRSELKDKVYMSMKLSAVIAIPCTFGLYFFAGPIMKFIFPQRYGGIEILKYMSVTIPFIIITQITTSILQGVDHYIRPVINLLIGCIVKIILTLTLVKLTNINIYGAVIASFSAYAISTILNIISMKQVLKIKLNLYSILIKPFYASVIMTLVSLIGYNIIYRKTMSNMISCPCAICIAIVMYFILMVVFKVFDIKDIKRRIGKL